MSLLFSPFSVGPLELANRVTVAPMCQYSALDGSMTDWHLQHLANLLVVFREGEPRPRDRHRDFSHVRPSRHHGPLD